eukprot:16916-Pyramimonas_sp.AAC.1
MSANGYVAGRSRPPRLRLGSPRRTSGTPCAKVDEEYGIYNNDFAAIACAVSSGSQSAHRRVVPKVAKNGESSYRFAGGETWRALTSNV